jgi:hypothetical protein
MESVLDGHLSIPTKLICREYTKKQKMLLRYFIPSGKKEYRYPCNRPWRPMGFKTSRLPHLLCSRLTEGG